MEGILEGRGIRTVSRHDRDGSLVAKKVTIVDINGEEYEVLTYVEPYLSKIDIGSRVGVTIREGKIGDEAGIKFVTKIWKLNGEVTGEPKSKDEKKSGKKHFVGVFRGSDGINAIITVDGENKTFNLSNEALDSKTRESFKTAVPCQIIVDVDAHNRIIGYEFGAVITDKDEEHLPSVKPKVQTAAEIKAEQKSQTTAPAPASGKAKEPAKAPEKEKAPKEPKKKKEEKSPEPASEKEPMAVKDGEETPAVIKAPSILMQYQRERIILLQACAKVAASLYTAPNVLRQTETIPEAVDTVVSMAVLIADRLTEEATK